MIKRYLGFTFSCLLLPVLASAQDVPVLASPAKVSEMRRPASYNQSDRRSLVSRSQASKSSASSAVFWEEQLSSQQPVDVVDFDLNLLDAPQINSGGVFGARGKSVPKAGSLELLVAGERYTLVWVDETSDHSAGARHITFQVLDRDSSYARFTVAGPEMAGTLVTPGATYRLLTWKGKTGVYRIAATELKRSGSYGLMAAQSTSIRKLERRHVQIEWLARVQPKRAMIVDPGRYVSVEGGSMGEIGPLTANSLTSAIRALGDPLYVPDRLELKVDAVRERLKHKVIEFRQLLNGIPVYGRNEITIDAANEIVGLTVQFADPGWAEDRPLITESEAIERAVERIEEANGKNIEEYEIITGPALSYLLTGPQELTPYFQLTLRELPNGRAVGVKVQAHSGDAVLLVAPQEIGWRIGDGNNQPAAIGLTGRSG